MIDAQGYIYLLGRTKDVIKYQALSLSPTMIEVVLNQIEGVEVKVVGRPHQTCGAVPVAVAKTLGGASANHGRDGDTT